MSLPYLLATLPPLDLEESAPMNLEDFFHEIKEQISEEEYLMVWQLLNDPDLVQHSTLKKWTLWYRSLRHELVLYRAKDLQRMEEGYLSVEPMPYAPIHLAEESLHALDPLIGQRRLREGEWEQLDLVESTHYQSIVNLGIYALRLSILIKMDLYDADQGVKRVEKFLENSISDAVMERAWEVS